jgi:hypothetical protein
MEHPITFAARDSLVIVFAEPADPNGDIGTLFGEARTAFDDGSLTAYEIDLLFARELLRARAAPDSDDLTGRPTFQRGQEGFTGRELAYHLPTQRGRLIGARTSMQDGYLDGGVVVQAGPRVTYAQDVVYTTCEYEEHSHWGLHTHRLKVVDGEWIYTGAARLHILGIPTPVWLPFGFFPAIDGRRSGPLPVDYGEQVDLGFYLRNIGYYWALSDYTDLQLSGGIFTSGSYEGQAQWRYARRYWYDGGLTIGYRNERRGERQDPGFTANNQASVTWRHAQTFNASGTSRLSGNVDLRTSGYHRSPLVDFDRRVQQQTSSRITYSQRWASGRNMTIGYSQNLNLSDGSTTITLPNISFNQPQWYPFRPAGSRGTSWFEQINLRYTGSLDNRFEFRPPPVDQRTPEQQEISWLDALFSHTDYVTATGGTERFRSSARHQIPLSTRIPVRYLPLVGPIQLDLNPNLSYSEDWHFRRNAPLTDEAGFVVRDTTGRPLFSTESAFAPVRNATFNVGTSTQIFGTFPLRVGGIDGVRHVLRPAVSFAYTPDYTGGFWGRQATYTEPDGTTLTYGLQGAHPLQFGPIRPTQFINLSLNNVLQTRLAREDRTGEVQRRVVQLFSLDANTGYNLAADSLNWRDVNVNFRSTIADQVTLNLTAVYSPYVVDEIGRNQNRLYFSETGLPLRFMTANFNASTQLRGRAGGGGPEIAAPRIRPPTFADLDGLAPGGLAPYDHRRPDLGFVDFRIPWSLSLDYNHGLTRNFRLGAEDHVISTLGATFDLGLTPTWRVSGRSGYDFASGEITPTQLSVLRDLHCWEMSATWMPFGQVRAFTFSIYVKSGHLQSLLRLDVPNVDRTRHF